MRTDLVYLIKYLTMSWMISNLHENLPTSDSLGCCVFCQCLHLFFSPVWFSHVLLTCVFRTCVTHLYVSHLCVSHLCVTHLCVSHLCYSPVLLTCVFLTCVTHLCVSHLRHSPVFFYQRFHLLYSPALCTYVTHLRFSSWVIHLFFSHRYLTHQHFSPGRFLFCLPVCLILLQVSISPAQWRSPRCPWFSQSSSSTCTTSPTAQYQTGLTASYCCTWRACSVCTAPSRALPSRRGSKSWRSCAIREWTMLSSAAGIRRS